MQNLQRETRSRISSWFGLILFFVIASQAEARPWSDLPLGATPIFVGGGTSSEETRLRQAIQAAKDRVGYLQRQAAEAEAAANAARANAAVSLAKRQEQQLRVQRMQRLVAEARDYLANLRAQADAMEAQRRETESILAKTRKKRIGEENELDKQAEKERQEELKEIELELQKLKKAPPPK